MNRFSPPDWDSAAETLRRKQSSASAPRDDWRSRGEVHPLARFVPLATQLRAPVFVLRGYVATGVSVIAGQHGVGKTTAVVAMALIAAGLHAPDCPLAPLAWRHVVYVTEDVDQVQRILRASAEHAGIDRAALAERFHVVPAQRLPIADIVEVAPVYAERFAREVRGVRVAPLVVVDTKAAVLDASDENDNAEASRIMARLKETFGAGGIPVWLIGHIAKASFARDDAAGLTMRGASAIEADAHATLFVVAEGDQRFVVRGKTRFEARWRDLVVHSRTAEAHAVDEFGDRAPITLRWAEVEPISADERAAAKASDADAVAAQKDAEARAEIAEAVQDAWEAGTPLSRNGAAASVKGNRAARLGTIRAMLEDATLAEIEVPKAARAHGSRVMFLVALDAAERAAFIRTGELPPAKAAIPPSWRKQPGRKRGKAAAEAAEAAEAAAQPGGADPAGDAGWTDV